MQLLKKTGSVNFIRKREQRLGKLDKLVYCSRCYAFVSTKYFGKHRKICMSNEATSTLPQAIPPMLFCEPGDKIDYLREILRTFRKDTIGKICVTDELIVGFGDREFKTIRNHKDKK